MSAKAERQAARQQIAANHEAHLAALSSLLGSFSAWLRTARLSIGGNAAFVMRGGSKPVA
ncbi:hypothetical protein [Kribbella albertanoniae]|uniref:Uncharacterized protein n=1 Tax=Kribbella albertanoniae TaxID=1266829 RepID=A0A4R4QDM5_9ACTN|nr:hypothetical protein [Kribbella albertanoniae]TDC33544.1 hypothetical protein E1261_05920 [Kribbella albertanoniae]